MLWISCVRTRYKRIEIHMFNLRNEATQWQQQLAGSSNWNDNVLCNNSHWNFLSYVGICSIYTKNGLCTFGAFILEEKIVAGFGSISIECVYFQQKEIQRKLRIRRKDEAKRVLKFSNRICISHYDKKEYL